MVPVLSKESKKYIIFLFPSSETETHNIFCVPTWYHTTIENRRGRRRPVSHGIHWEGKLCPDISVPCGEVS